MFDDVVVIGEDAVRQPVVTHELPDVFDRVQLWRPRRQEQEGDVVGNIELGCCVPSGLVKNENGVGAGINGDADLLEMVVHGADVAIGQDEARTLALPGTDSAADVGPHGALIVRGRWPCAATGPAARDLVLLPYPSFVLPPKLDFGAFGEHSLDGCQRGGEVFLKASTSNSFWA